MSAIHRAVHAAGRAYLKKILALEAQRAQPDARGQNERPIEYAFALNHLQQSPHMDVLDVGTGQSAWPSILQTCGFCVTACDEMGGYWSDDYFNRHFFVQRHDITAGPMDGRKFGNITCLSTLEHIPDSEAAMHSMAAMLKPDGRLILSFPWNERIYSPNIYDHPGAGYGKGNPYICQIYNRKKLAEWLRITGLRVLEQRYYCCFTGELWTMGVRLRPMHEVSVGGHLSCLSLTS